MLKLNTFKGSQIRRSSSSNQKGTVNMPYNQNSPYNQQQQDYEPVMSQYSFPVHQPNSNHEMQKPYRAEQERYSNPNNFERSGGEFSVNSKCFKFTISVKLLLNCCRKRQCLRSSKTTCSA
jgi:hypothetical protein